jgi:hypothetical protein
MPLLSKTISQVFKLQRTYNTANRLYSLFNGAADFLTCLLPVRSQAIAIKREKIVFPMLINSKSIFLQP